MEEEKKRQKMAAFLQAATEGRLGGRREPVTPNKQEVVPPCEQETIVPTGKDRQGNGGEMVIHGPPDPIIWQAARQQLVSGFI